MKCSQEYYFTSNWQSVLIYQRLPAKPEHCIPHLFTSTCCYGHLECEDPSPGRWLGSWENSAHDGWREQETTWHKYNIWIGVEWLLGIICHAWVAWKNGCFYTQNWVEMNMINFLQLHKWCSYIFICFQTPRLLEFKICQRFFLLLFLSQTARVRVLRFVKLGKCVMEAITISTSLYRLSQIPHEKLYFFLSRLLYPDFLFWSL